MSAITVQGVGQLSSVLMVLRMELQDLRGLWNRIEARLPAEQTRWWASRFGQSITHHERTIEARAEALTFGGGEKRGANYYERTKPGPSAAPASPYYYWTGSLQEATSRFSAKEKAKATIETEKTYRGPLGRKYRDPVERIMVNGRHRVNPWDTKAIESIVDQELEGWLVDIASKIGGVL